MAKPMAIAAIIAAAVAAKYISVGGNVICGYGEAVGPVESTAKYA